MKYFFHSLRIIFLCNFYIFIFFVFCDAEASVQRHLLCFGGIQESDLIPIANYADILIVGNVNESSIKKIKRLKPNIIILKYCHVTGYHTSHSDWGVVQGHEDWFAHDKKTSEKMVERKYGWYLMNIENYSYRQYVTNRVVQQAPKIYDGVFIDDFWGEYVNKFVKERNGGKASPDNNLKLHWNSLMIMVLQNLKGKYHGLVYINGISEKYAPYVDGFMYEGFVHSYNNANDFTSDQASYQRSLLKVSRLQKYGKRILLQSAGGSNQQHKTLHLRDYCLSSFLLIQDSRTSFDFRPSRGYFIRGLSADKAAEDDLGAPLCDYYMAKEDPMDKNLLPNGSFDENLSSWMVASGYPECDKNIGMKSGSAHFLGNEFRKDRLRSNFIPVKENVNYIISLSCKTNENSPGSSDYMKFGVQGRFYDKGFLPIPGAYDLQFDAGNFDWQPYEVTYKSPNGACFFKITLGFIGNGKGEGWVDNVYFGQANKRGRVLRRDFQYGCVLLNFGDKEMLLDIGEDDTLKKGPIWIGPREGLIIYNK